MTKKPRKPAFETRKGTVADAISGAVSELTSLGEECREVFDNMPESLQQGSRGEAMDSTAGTLEDVQELDVPEVLGALACTWTESLPKRKGRGLSRAVRCGNAVTALEAAINAVQAWHDEQESKQDDASEEPEVDAESLLTELEEIKDNADGCEFPGMYG